MPARESKPPSRAVEDYIKQICKLEQQGGKVTTKALAERLSLGRGTVSGMLRQLAARDLIEHKPYYGVRLTDQGNRLAMQMIRRHRLIEQFLVETLGLGWDEVDDAAERMEHAVSDEVIHRIDEYLGHPKVDPHGAPIPTESGEIAEQDFRQLSDLQTGQTCRVRRVSDHEAGFLQYLHELGIDLDAKLEVLAIDPFGTMHVRVDDQEAHLAREATHQIHVSD